MVGVVGVAREQWAGAWCTSYLAKFQALHFSISALSCFVSLPLRETPFAALDGLSGSEQRCAVRSNLQLQSCFRREPIRIPGLPLGASRFELRQAPKPLSSSTVVEDVGGLTMPRALRIRSCA